MEIYVRVDTENRGPSWYVRQHDGCGSYLAAGDSLETTNPLGYEYMRGSAAKSWEEARRWAKDARMLANFDGMGRAKVSYWKWRGGKCVKAVQPKKRPGGKNA